MLSTDLFFGPVAVTLALGGISILFLYWLSVRPYNYWKKRGIPSANTVPLLGSLHESFSKVFHEVECKRYNKLGRIYGYYEGSTPLLSVAEPELVKNILVKDFGYFHDRRIINSGNEIIDNMLSVVQGEDWKRIRSIVSPTFTTRKIKRMLNIFKECAKALDQNIRNAGEGAKYVEIKRLYEAFTMDVIASSAFSTKIDSHNDPTNMFVKMAQRAFNVSLNFRLVLFVAVPRLFRALKLTAFDKEPLDFFVKVTNQIVEERKKSGKSRNDFLQLLMDTAKEGSEEEKWDNEEKGDIATNYEQGDIEQQILKNVTSKNLSNNEMVAQSVIFFLAGYHTTVATLSFATYCLAINPEVQDKLRKDVDEVLKESNGDITYEALQSMKYLDNVISETLRIFPPGIRIERLAVADYELGDTGITIPKGMIISIPNYAMQKDPEFFPEPDKFDPDRFTPEERETRDPYTYLPFGAGPRNCVGMRFALTKIKLCLAYVIAKYNIKRCPETKVPIEFYFGQGLLKPTSVTVEMEVRKDSLLVT